MKITVKIDDRDVQEALKALGALRKREMVDAAEDGARVLVEAANRRAPRPVVETNIRKKTADEVLIEIGVPKEKYFYAIFETGADKHAIGPHKKQTMYFEGKDGDMFSKAVKHPGFASRPFLRPAFDEQQDAAQAAVKTRLAKAIEELARRNAARSRRS